MSSVLAVLCLSANTSFAGFPRLCRQVARDEYLPRAFAISGRRLVNSVGILWLAGTAAILLVIIGMYFILGCLLDSLAMILLTIPIVFPIISALGYDPVWFGIIIVMVVELGLITPPIGMNVFIIKGIARDVPLYTIFRGVTPFIVAQIVLILILIAFPQIALWLPSTMG